MGKRGKKGENKVTGNNHTTLSIREEASGRKQSHNPKSLLKLNHLHNLALWASGQDQFSQFGAFFGHCFADFGESLGIAPDPNLFPCQSCETLLQPGSNCTVRIEKIKAKRRRHAKLKTPAQNNAVYTCHFCSYRNLKRGTPKGYMKELAPSKVIYSKPASGRKSVPQNCSTTEKTCANNANIDELNPTPSPAASNAIDFQMGSPANQMVATGVKLLDSKRKRKKPGPKKSVDEALVSSAPAQLEKGGGTSKKRRKSWTTLKEIAENEERERTKRFSNFSIPFVL